MAGCQADSVKVEFDSCQTAQTAAVKVGRAEKRGAVTPGNG